MGMKIKLRLVDFVCELRDMDIKTIRSKIKSLSPEGKDYSCSNAYSNSGYCSIHAALFAVSLVMLRTKTGASGCKERDRGNKHNIGITGSFAERACCWKR